MRCLENVTWILRANQTLIKTTLNSSETKEKGKKEACLLPWVKFSSFLHSFRERLSTASGFGATSRLSSSGSVAA